MMTFRKAAVMALVLGSTAMVGCASNPADDPDMSAVRERLTALQNDPQLSSRAPVAIVQAERAVNAAETSIREGANREEINHRIYLANNRIELARTEAERRLANDQVTKLGEERERAILDARTREADMLREQLNARETDRGMVVTLGDVLFETGKSDLKSGARSNLNRLAQFMNEYPDRTVKVEGHTDSTGSDAINRRLSQERADSVKNYLVSQGISGSRITTEGKSKDFPLADNSTAAGRQQNRRVEIIISQ